MIASITFNPIPDKNGYFLGTSEDGVKGLYSPKQKAWVEKTGSMRGFHGAYVALDETTKYVTETLASFPEDVQKAVNQAPWPMSEKANALKEVQKGYISHQEAIDYLKCRMADPTGDYTLKWENEFSKRLGRKRL